MLNWTIDYLGQRDPDRAVAARAWSSATRPPPSRRGQPRHVPRRRRGRDRRLQGDVDAVPAAARLHAGSCATPPTPRSATTTRRSPTSRRDDLSDWAWVTIAPKASPADRTPVIQPYDLPALRAATTLTLSLPRYGFYTTPAFLALWNTNDSNQHRVTANQALLVALGQAFTAENTDHAVHGGGPRRAPRRRGQRVRRLPRDAGPDAPVLGEPARLQRPQRLPGRQPEQPRQPAADGRAGQRVRVRRHPRAPDPASRTSATTSPR